MRFKVGGVDHQNISRRPGGSGQFFEDFLEDALARPANEPVVERFVRAIFTGRITPALPIANNEYNSTQNTPIINTRATVGFGKMRPKAVHMRLMQPKQITHGTTPF